MKLSKQWAMLSAQTFSIKPIKELISATINNYMETNKNIYNPLLLDPFANNCKIKEYLMFNTPDVTYISNDLDETMPTDYHLDALEFLKIFDDESIDIVLFDPPFSPRQVSECYRRLGKTVNFETTNSSFWSQLKREIARILTFGGLVISCGWSSGGIGKNNGFEQLEILLVAHGGHHNDTICVVDKKSLKSV